MAAANVLLAITNNAKDQLNELQNERDGLIKRLNEVQAQIVRLELHLLLEGTGAKDDNLPF